MHAWYSLYAEVFLSVKIGFKHREPCKSVEMCSNFPFTSADVELTVNPAVAFLHAFNVRFVWTFYEFTF